MKKLLLLCLVSIFALSCARGPYNGSDKGPYLIKVNDAKLSEGEIRAELDMLPQEVMRAFEGEEGIEDLMKKLAEKEMLYQESLTKGLQNGEEFSKRLNMFKKRLAVEMLLEEEVEKKTAVSDEDVRDFYEKNKENFVAEVPGNGKKGVMEFEVVENVIRRRLMAEKQREVFEKYMSTLREQYTIALDREAIKAAFGNRITP